MSVIIIRRRDDAPEEANDFLAGKFLKQFHEYARQMMEQGQPAILTLKHSEWYDIYVVPGIVLEPERKMMIDASDGSRYEEVHINVAQLG